MRKPVFVLMSLLAHVLNIVTTIPLTCSTIETLCCATQNGSKVSGSLIPRLVHGGLGTRLSSVQCYAIVHVHLAQDELLLEQLLDVSVCSDE